MWRVAWAGTQLAQAEMRETQGGFFYGVTKIEPI
jgi:hypothetical protein